mmetsp:Transcript_79899/g.258379  ORF Transcript_79899/g.258379 Transcript_79899/m.258379 type:complete len:193 (-) Transcript_79899:1353-1931(-)
MAYSFEGGPTELNFVTGERSVPPGYSELSRHNQNAIIDMRDLSDTYLLAFESCARSGAMGLMCSYNQVNATPSCGNKAFETDLMRDKWGFDGVIVTDCDSIADMYYLQHWKSTQRKRSDLLSRRARISPVGSNLCRNIPRGTCYLCSSMPSGGLSVCASGLVNLIRLPRRIASVYHRACHWHVRQRSSRLCF